MRARATSPWSTTIDMGFSRSLSHTSTNARPPFWNPLAGVPPSILPSVQMKSTVLQPLYSFSSSSRLSTRPAVLRRHAFTASVLPVPYDPTAARHSAATIGQLKRPG